MKLTAQFLKEHHIDTTSYVAGGIWLPLGTFGPEADHMLPQIRDWFLETREYFQKLIGELSNLI